MCSFVMRLTVASGLVLMLATDSYAVRVMTTNPLPGTVPLQFDNFTLTPDGASIVATGLSDTSGGDRVYSFPIPSDPNTQTATITQLSTGSFAVNAYDVAFTPVLSPNGQTVLFVHDGNGPGSNTIYTMPIAGEFANNSFTGLFGVTPNLVSPGNGNSFPTYSPDGSTIFFLNNNSGFGGSIPSFPGSPTPFDPEPDWDQLYSVPAAGGSPTAVTAPGDGDIDGGLFAVTPDGSSIIYAPDSPVVSPTSRGGMRPKLFSIPTSGGTATQIPLKAPGHAFTLSSQLSTTADGQQVLFIADYDTVGKHELYSLPLAGGTPTRISDDLPFAGDVYSFKISPNGSSVAYSASQNVSSNSELFLTPITGGTGNSIRVSEPAPSNSGDFDVSTSAEGGQIFFSSDSTSIYYLGDLNTEDINDLYVVDTTEKLGLVPSSYFFTGLSGGDFFDEANWNDDPNGFGNNPAPDTINPATPIRLSLIIDGDTVGSTGGEADFQVGGSLELTKDSLLNFTTGGNLDFNPGSGLKITDATVRVVGDIILEGTNHWVGGLVESTGDDVEFQDGHETFINGTTIRSVVDNILFENSLTSVSGATFVSEDRLGLRYELDITLTDTNINVRGFTPGTDPGGDGQGDIEDIFAGAQGAGSTLTLKGASTLLANAIQDGVSLVLDGLTVATLLGNDDPNNVVDLVQSPGMITFASTVAEMITLHASASDVRDRVINGFTGMSYLDDPNAWTVTNWDGISPLPSLQLVSIPGDLDGDNDVDGFDFLLIQRTDPSLIPIWEANYGTSIPLTASVTTVPEPGAMGLLGAGLAAWASSRRRSSRAVPGGRDAAPHLAEYRRL